MEAADFTATVKLMYTKKRVLIVAYIPSVALMSLF